MEFQRVRGLIFTIGILFSDLFGWTHYRNFIFHIFYFFTQTFHVEPERKQIGRWSWAQKGKKSTAREDWR